MKIYIFNPDTDMALANNEAHYMAPSSIRCMEHDLALLPVWYAPHDAAVLAPSAYNARHLQAMRQLFDLSGKPSECEAGALGLEPGFPQAHVGGRGE